METIEELKERIAVYQKDMGVFREVSKYGFMFMINEAIANARKKRSNGLFLPSSYTVSFEEVNNELIKLMFPDKKE